ncbi:delta-60 repeat domain-containing protein [Roseimicrobium gellanilyticum]|nr:delta-60 repeat domain-containing protein [Roseimicrobium gellanilyticum]
MSAVAGQWSAMRCTNRRLQVLLQIFLMLVVRTAAVTAQSGALDLTFGSDGFVMTPFAAIQKTSFNSQRTKLKVPIALYPYCFGLYGAVQNDGKIIVICDNRVGYNFGEYIIAMARYEPSGELDTTFGVGGKVTFSSGAERREACVGLEILSDGHIMVSGRSVPLGKTPANSSDGEILLLKYKPDGSPDPGFGENGVKMCKYGHPGDGKFFHRTFKAQPDGRLLVAGGTFTESNKATTSVARFTPDGVLDPAFGNAGRAPVPLPNNGKLVVDDAISLPDGKCLVAGWLHFGKFTLDASTRPFVYSALLCLNGDGSIDTNFGKDGRVAMAMGGLNSFDNRLALQGDGKIIVATKCGPHSASNSGQSIGLFRYLPNGMLDDTFGRGGKVTAYFPRVHAVSEALVLGDGRIAVAGEVEGCFALTLFLPNGAPDVSFGKSGLMTYEPADWAESKANQAARRNKMSDPVSMQVGGALLQKDGKIVIFGSIPLKNSSRVLGMVRINVK